MESIDILRLKERIDIAIELGESHFREFKSCYEGPPTKKTPRDPKKICQDVARTLVAFANADGGELLVGVEDNGEITGTPYKNEVLKCILEAKSTYVYKDTPLPISRATIIEYKGAKIIYFSVYKGQQFVHLTSDGRCLQRKDLESIPISSEEIRFSRQEKTSREYDRQFVDEASLKDLNVDLISNISQELYSSISPEKLLQHLELAEFDGQKLRLRKAALLLFARNPYKWHPRLQVRIIKVDGPELKSGKEFNVINDEEISDNIINLIESGWDLLRPYLTETRFSENAMFRTQIIYPELACREALINAIAHRDYSVEGRGIEIYIFNDRLEIVNPGELLSSIKIEDLKSLRGVHQSRNSLVSRSLREFGYMRELGEGIRRIYELMKKNDFVSPDIQSEKGNFKIILYQKLIYTKEEQLWLKNFDELDLTREQTTIVRLGCNGKLISPNDIWESIGIVDTDYYRQLIESLTSKGILIRAVDKNTAYKKAKQSKIPKKKIPQFKIVLPKKESPVSIDDKIRLDDSDYSKIYITNLPYDVTIDEIKTIFKKFGDISNIQIPKNRETGKSRGFAFVEFDTNDAADSAYKHRKLIYIRDRKIYVQKYKKR